MRRSKEAVSNHAAAVRRFRVRQRDQWIPINATVGPNPMPCRPFRAHAAAVMQRLTCVRRDACLDIAVRRDWQAFTCSGCGVLEEAEDEAPLRASWDGVMPADTGRR